MTHAGFLLDTNVISEFARLDCLPDVKVEKWLNSIQPSMLFTSTLVCGEIQKGIEQLGAGRRRAHLERWLSQDLQEWLGPRVLSVDRAIAISWGRLTIAAKADGIQLPVIDGLIAATALEHGLIVATRNGRHFSGIGVEFIDPWISH